MKPQLPVEMQGSPVRQLQLGGRPQVDGTSAQKGAGGTHGGA